VYTPDGKRLITAGPGKTVTVWDADSGDELLVLDDVHGLPRDLAVSEDNRQLAASVGLLPNAGKIVIWDGQRDEQPGSHTGHKRTSSASEP
jgi:WD40 repeat protein